jgi:histidinol-phosphate aminotransferase
MSPALSFHAQNLPSSVPFVGPEAIERKNEQLFMARLGANENGFGPSPRVISAMQAAASEMWQYPDPDNFELKQAVARHFGVGFENVNIGGGIDGLLGHTVRLYLNPGDNVVTSLGVYPTFGYQATGFGAQLIPVPYKDDHQDLEAMLAAAIREKPKLVYLANPDNPMGTWHNGAKIAEFAAALPPQTMLILDEAYGDVAQPEMLPIIDVETPNVLRYRTFSKAYGLAGLRIGAVFGPPEAVSAFDRVRNHFEMSRMAQVAALVALADKDYLEQTINYIKQSRDSIHQIARDCGLRSVPSATNFVSVDCGRDGIFAKQVMDGLIDRRIFVRKPFAPILDRCIRVSCGPEAEMSLFANALRDTLASN